MKSRLGVGIDFSSYDLSLPYFTEQAQNDLHTTFFIPLFLRNFHDYAI